MVFEQFFIPALYGTGVWALLFALLVANTSSLHSAWGPDRRLHHHTTRVMHLAYGKRWYDRLVFPFSFFSIEGTRSRRPSIPVIARYTLNVSWRRIALPSPEEHGSHVLAGVLPLYFGLSSDATNTLVANTTWLSGVSRSASITNPVPVQCIIRSYCNQQHGRHNGKTSAGRRLSGSFDVIRWEVRRSLDSLLRHDTCNILSPRPTQLHYTWPDGLVPRILVKKHGCCFWLLPGSPGRGLSGNYGFTG